FRFSAKASRPNEPSGCLRIPENWSPLIDERFTFPPETTRYSHWPSGAESPPESLPTSLLGSLSLPLRERWPKTANANAADKSNTAMTAASVDLTVIIDSFGKAALTLPNWRSYNRRSNSTSHHH